MQKKKKKEKQMQMYRYTLNYVIIHSEKPLPKAAANNYSWLYILVYKQTRIEHCISHREL